MEGGAIPRRAHLGHLHPVPPGAPEPDPAPGVQQAPVPDGASRVGPRPDAEEPVRLQQAPDPLSVHALAARRGLPLGVGPAGVPLDRGHRQGEGWGGAAPLLLAPGEDPPEVAAGVRVDAHDGQRRAAHLLRSGGGGRPQGRRAAPGLLHGGGRPGRRGVRVGRRLDPLQAGCRQEGVPRARGRHRFVPRRAAAVRPDAGKPYRGLRRLLPGRAPRGPPRGHVALEGDAAEGCRDTGDAPAAHGRRGPPSRDRPHLPRARPADPLQREAQRHRRLDRPVREPEGADPGRSPGAGERLPSPARGEGPVSGHVRDEARVPRREGPAAGGVHGSARDRGRDPGRTRRPSGNRQSMSSPAATPRCWSATTSRNSR